MFETTAAGAQSCPRVYLRALRPGRGRVSRGGCHPARTHLAVALPAQICQPRTPTLVGSALRVAPAACPVWPASGAGLHGPAGTRERGGRKAADVEPLAVRAHKTKRCYKRTRCWTSRCSAWQNITREKFQDSAFPLCFISVRRSHRFALLCFV